MVLLFADRDRMSYFGAAWYTLSDMWYNKSLGCSDIWGLEAISANEPFCSSCCCCSSDMHSPYCNAGKMAALQFAVCNNHINIQFLLAYRYINRALMLSKTHTDSVWVLL